MPRYFSHAKNVQNEKKTKKIYSTFKMKSVKELSCGGGGEEEIKNFSRFFQTPF